MEMEAVVDIFDRDGDGYIDYKEFVAALRPDSQVGDISRTLRVYLRLALHVDIILVYVKVVQKLWELF